MRKLRHQLLIFLLLDGQLLLQRLYRVHWLAQLVLWSVRRLLSCLAGLACSGCCWLCCGCKTSVGTGLVTPGSPDQAAGPPGTARSLVSCPCTDGQ